VGRRIRTATVTQPVLLGGLWRFYRKNWKQSLDIQPHVTPETEDDFSDLFGVIYVERSTSLLYEVKFFDGFVLVRPASPAFYQALRKISHTEFADEFEEYGGDQEAVINHIRGEVPELVID
jgi:hypothetical protein